MVRTIGSLFSGIGGLELGLERSGVGRVVWQVENDPFCRQLLTRHFPDVARLSDVRYARDLPPVDIVCGGFPCQDVSAAGKGAGLAGDRSGLWYEFRRIVEEITPPIVVVENVASGKRRWLPAVRRDLHVLGYHSTPYAVSAADVGANHLRRRIFVVAYHHSVTVRHRPERQPARRARGVRGEGRAEPQHAREAMAHADGGRLRSGVGKLPAGQPDSDGGGEAMADRDRDGFAFEPASRVHDRWAFWNDAGRRGGYPPRPDDVDAWSAYVAGGGPQPGIRRGADGLPAGVDLASLAADDATRAERLRVLGNAVVPACAEVIGRIILADLGA